MNTENTGRISKGALFFILPLLLFIGACGGSSEEPTTAGTQDWDGGYADAERRINTLKASLYEDPKNEDMLSALGDAYFEAQRYLDAIKEYDKVVEINPQNADCLNDRALALFYTGQHDAALDSVEKAIAVDAVYNHAWLTKGFILMSLKRYDEAQPVLEKVQELDPLGSLGAEAENFLNQIKVVKGEV
ncbi:MAG: tetratricopeptide repeat protein [Proteobacteria bacterium]|nr:tetratricopeptide repeat protein [Pseudomonadota bacterium]